MGVPSLFRWLSQKYPKIVSPVIEERPREINGEEIPVDTTTPNPNGEEFDNLYLDMNGIVHPCSHPEDRPAPSTEAEMMLEVFRYTERVVNMVRPRKLLMIAVDGVAPRAKMNQQRSRRFRSAQEAQEKDADKAELIKLLKVQNGGILPDGVLEEMNKKTWDSNAITPGTPFMDILALSLRYWIAYKLNTDPAWEKRKVIISDATVPGEGEHKIMNFIRSQRSSPEHDPNTRHVIYGLDADLIMLGLATHEPHFRVIREDVFFQEGKAKTCRICGQTGHFAAECRGEVKQKQGEFDEKGKTPTLKPFIWLHVSILREYLAVEMHVPNQRFHFDLERALDDWVFMCFFVGNDFLPHLPSLDIREGGIDTLIAIWRDNIPIMGDYLTRDGQVNLEGAQHILAGLAKQEDAIFQRRHVEQERQEANAKRRKLEQDNRSRPNKTPSDKTPLSAADFQLTTLDSIRDQTKSYRDRNLPGTGQSDNNLTHQMIVNRNDIQKANAANKSAAAILKERMNKGKLADVEEPTSAAQEQTVADGEQSSPPSAPGKRKRDLAEEGPEDDGTLGRHSPNPTGPVKKVAPDEPPPDNVRMWEEGYADRYYEAKFHVRSDDHDFRHKVARSYVEGLSWVLAYYSQGCPSWSWYYPYHYAPFAADFVDLGKMKINFERGTAFRPFEQLMAVMPAASNHTIPKVFHELMTSEESDIVDFYPPDFEVDLNGKKFAWQGIAILPFIDEKRLLAAMATRYPLLTENEVKRNSFGHEALLFSERHPLYEVVATNFYSKKKGANKFDLVPRVSEGLSGVVEKNEDYLPQSALQFPLPEGGLPDLDEDHSISVHYEMPKSKHVHKSMLLRGVNLPKPALDQGDIDQTKNRATKSGRSYGGVPFRGAYGGNGGRGGGYGGGYGGGRGGGGGGGGGNGPNGHGGINYGNKPIHYGSGQNHGNGPIHYGSGQTHGNGPNNYGNGAINQAEDRPNPFAAHLNPAFFPNGMPTGPNAAGWIPPPPHVAFGGRMPQMPQMPPGGIPGLNGVPPPGWAPPPSNAGHGRYGQADGNGNGANGGRRRY